MAYYNKPNRRQYAPNYGNSLSYETDFSKIDKAQKQFHFDEMRRLKNRKKEKPYQIGEPGKGFSGDV